MSHFHTNLFFFSKYLLSDSVNKVLRQEAQLAVAAMEIKLNKTWHLKDDTPQRKEKNGFYIELENIGM